MSDGTVSEGTVATTPGAAPNAPRRRRRRWIVLGAVVGALIATGIAFAFVLDRQPGPASVDEAVDEFAGGGDHDDGAGGARNPPPDGVYVYEGAGSESLSILPGSHDQGPRLPGTVTHRDGGCWDFRIEYHEDHWQEWHYCPGGDATTGTRAGDLVEQGGVTYQAWDLGVAAIGNTSTFRCADSVVIRAGAEPGDRWHQECTGTSDTVDGTTVSAGATRFVGEETVTVAGEDVPALHYHQVRDMSDAQRGRQVEDFWFRASDGLPLRNTRSASIDSDSPVGAITYAEDGEWRLTSLTPRT